MSGRPKTIKNYLTLMKPFDKLTWLSLALSIPSMVVAIFVVDKYYAKWNNLSMSNILHQSKVTNFRQKLKIY